MDSTKKLQNITQLKAELQTVIKNITKLEAEDSSTSACKDTMELTDCLLKHLEKEPLKKVAKKIIERKRRRLINKHRKNKVRILRTKKLQMNSSQTLSDAKTIADKQQITMNSQEDDAAPTNTKISPSHMRLCKQHDAQQFLRRFELLKMLYWSRSQGDVVQTRHFAVQMNNLQSIWNNILLENTPQHTRESNIEDQWNEVFFGISEMTYYVAKQCKISDFLQIRRTWDTYLTNKKYGSSIPIGWILPEQNANERWITYRKNT